MKNAGNLLPELAELQAIAAIARDGTITKAAQSLNLSQSALSYALDRARAKMADPLFIRVGNRMEPTPYAARLAAAAERVLGVMADEMARLEDFDPKTTQRSFRVAINEIGVIAMLPSILRRLQTEAPRARIVPVQVRSHDVEAQLASNAIDLAAGHFPQVGGGVMQQQLFRRNYVCIVRTDHPEIGAAVSFEQLARTPHVANQMMPTPLLWLRGELQQRGLGLPIALEIPHGAAIPFIIGATNYTALVAEEVYALFRQGAGIRAVTLPAELPPVAIGQYWHPKMSADPANRFLRTLVQTTRYETVAQG